MGDSRSQTVHFHFAVTANGKAFTSLLVFERSLVNDAFKNHAEHKEYGVPDTSNATDRDFGKSDLATFTLGTSRMADAAILASKLLVVSV